MARKKTNSYEAKDVISAYGRLLEYTSNKKYNRVNSDFKRNDPIDEIALTINYIVKTNTTLDIFELEDQQAIINYENIVNYGLVDFTYIRIIKEERIINEDFITDKFSNQKPPNQVLSIESYRNILAARNSMLDYVKGNHSDKNSYLGYLANIQHAGNLQPDRRFK